MKKKFSAVKQYEKTRKAIGYVPRRKATGKDYQRIGFLSGLEVHQQLKTGKKLFCSCPAGIYHDDDDFSAEVIRHMRPTLSELGEYDGTALMEFKTRKEIVYRIHNDTACTYEIDDTPPFPINREALEIALEISLLCKLNIVGEVHITRKQYLDGSIPTGFQRTAILGVEGEIRLKNKKVRLLQLSIEEDSCREISDVGHRRIFKTDRLGMPLIETVTYPDMFTPDELREAAEYIRFLNRSTGRVRTGMGAAREDVNVSCRGGSRVEIKGVAHNSWIPELSHNEAFRQYALLNIRSLLNERFPEGKGWKPAVKEISCHEYPFKTPLMAEACEKFEKVLAVNLPGFHGILSHFTQPGKGFASELSDRLKVIACIEKPNMICSEELENPMAAADLEQVKRWLDAGENDAQLVIWGPEDDIPTALETIEERCLIAFEGVPRETRKSMPDGTTLFERVLPGPDRMYPDTDSPPIPLEDDYIEKLKQNLPPEVADRYRQLMEWEVPGDTYFYLLRKNLVPLMEKIHRKTGISYRFIGTFLGHTLKHLEGKITSHPHFGYEKIYGLFRYLHENGLDPALARPMLPEIMKHPDMQFGSVLTTIRFKKKEEEELLAPIGFLYEKFKDTARNPTRENAIHWLMGQIQKQAVGNIPLAVLRSEIEERLKKMEASGEK
ncbi:MAG TPA: Glu-tRNA(Gln) amidotransferase subunit GatE [Bacteroidetes bacterium]|nr:Glu-tRNA(Gln) amidotransferase subunit GatE [Bacteroidota bacterium]